MVTRLQTRSVQAQASIIRGYFDEITAAVKSFPNFERGKIRSKEGSETEGLRRAYMINESRRRRIWRTNIIGMWNQEQKWMKYELEAAEGELGQLQAELKLSRNSRGALPFIGDALKWAFGTSTEEDTKRLHKRIKGIEAGVGKLHHLIELQTTVLGALREGQKTNAHNIRTLANETQRVLQAVVRGQNEATLMRKTTHKTIRQEADISQAVASAIRTTGAAVLAFRQEVHRLCEAMDHTQRGEVTPTILPFKALKETLTEIQQRLPGGWVLATSSTTNTADMYQTLTLTAHALRDGWEAHIRVPLKYQPYGKFELYKVTSIPTHFINSTAALETETGADYFAISNDHRLHMNLKEEDVTRCQKHRSGTYCMEFTPLVQEQRRGCLYDAFRGNTKETDVSCRRRVTKPPPQLFTIAENRWIYIFPTMETFSLECVGKPAATNVFNLQGTGVFTLPLGCTAIGDRYLVPPHLTRTSNTVVNISSDSMTHFEINLDVGSLLTRLPGEVEVNQKVLVELIERLPEDRQTDMTLQDLKKRVEDWEIKTVPEDDWDTTVIQNTNLTFSTIAFITGIIGIVILCCKYKGREEAKNTVTYVAGQDPSAEFQGGLDALQARIERLERDMKETREKQSELQRMM